MAKTKAVVGLDIQTGQFISSVKKVDTQWQRFKKNIFSVKNAIGAVFAGAAVNKMLSFGKEIIGLAQKQYKADAQLVAALKEKNLYTEKNFQSLSQYATKQQYATLMQDQEIMAVQRSLIQYGLWGDQLEHTTKLVLDMAANGKGMAMSAEAMGRAFQGNYMALTRVDNKIREAVVSGAGFNEVLQIMIERYRGQSDAVGQTPFAKLERINLLWGDFKESVGIGLVKSLAGLSDELKITDERVSQLGSTMGTLVTSGAEEFFYDIARAVNAVSIAFQSIGAIANIGKLFTPAGPIKFFQNILTGEKAFSGLVDFSGVESAVASGKSLAERSERAQQRRISAEIDYYARGLRDGAEKQRGAIKNEIKNAALARR